MIDDIERYKWITSQVNYFADRMRDNFKLYIQLATAIIGGFIWLQIQPDLDNHKLAVLKIVPTLLLILGIFMSILIWVDYRCWYQYREAESELIGGKYPPRFPNSAGGEVFMTIAILSSSVSGFFFLK